MNNSGIAPSLRYAYIFYFRLDSNAETKIRTDLGVITRKKIYFVNVRIRIGPFLSSSSSTSLYMPKITDQTHKNLITTDAEHRMYSIRRVFPVFVY